MSMETVEQEVLERLSVFAGGFMLEAAQAVCADDPIHHDEIPHLLSHLVDRSLVEVDQTEKEQRYRLSEELRAAVHERLVARGQAKKCHLTLVNYLYELAKQGWGRMSRGEAELFTTANGSTCHAVAYACSSDLSACALCASSRFQDG